MKLLVRMTCLVFMIAIPVKVYSFEVNGRYLNYGNGMINMDNVTHIQPRINYVVTLPGDQADDYFKQYGTSDVLDSTQMHQLWRWFNVHYMKEDYYFLEIEAYIKFDDFTLTMIPKQRYLKLPSDQDMERVKALHGGEKFMRFFEHIQNRPEFKSTSILSLRNTREIADSLERLSNGYENIYEGDSFFWWWPF